MTKILLILAVFGSIQSVQAAGTFFELNGVRYPMSAMNYQGGGLLTVTSPLRLACNFAAPTSANSVLVFNGYQTNYVPSSFSYAGIGNGDYVLKVTTAAPASCQNDSIFENGFEF